MPVQLHAVAQVLSASPEQRLLGGEALDGGDGSSCHGIGRAEGGVFCAPATPPRYNAAYFYTGAASIVARANAAAGLGGNIALFTTPDGTGSTPYLATKQAVGIENDQSTHMFGNLITSNVYVPTHANSGGTTGQISFDSSHIYVCLGPNNWMRANIAGGW